ncbi:rhodanese-like domain-containing protein [Streptomyces sp. NBC_01320]|uniref:rhodanese-like domain-containing protein n=1 Tax=Streptomyces sp. NBC_01320 TaxID=2903824 RepID=UPI002E0EA674|nr:rhodanese-like domain-containing protein [Streptomyces sp. NBC_01320]WSK00833.1 rhodanese-like domain-containing protein [Streptomyces sp. NBC_01320]
MREVDLDVFAAKLANGAFVIDVREPDEYRAGHVPGARLAPLSTLGAVADDLPSDRPVYVMCASGNRSGRAAEHLQAIGVDAVSVAGGTAARARAGCPVARGAAAEAA